MYSPSTYFYWFIIICIRVCNTIIFFIIRPFRGIINKKFKEVLAKHGVEIIERSKKSEDAVKEDNLTEDSGRITLVMKDPNLFLRIIAQGSVALGEGYMHDDWECDEIQLLTKRLWAAFGSRSNPLHRIRDKIYLKATATPWDSESAEAWITSLARNILSRIMSNGTTFSSGYWDDLGNGPTKEMTSSVTFSLSDSNSNSNPSMDRRSLLAQSLTRNMEILCKKLELQPGMQVLDVGCGTGEFSLYLSKHFDVRVVGVTNSKDEIDQAREKCFTRKNTTFYEGDYTALLDEYQGKFDRVICLHIMEHIGGPAKYYTFFNVLSQYLNSNGKLLLQSNVLIKALPVRVDLLGRKYLMHKLIVPYITELLDNLRTRFEIDSIESIQQHYSKTLEEYSNNLNQAEVEGNLITQEEEKYGKIIDFSLKIMCVAFGMRKVDVWQVVASKIKHEGIFTAK